MNNETDHSRKHVGCLKINNISYPVYEGINVIGRDLKATIRVPDLKFSKQHAILTVVDNKHLISDFNSSNGTQLRNANLIPYKCYTLNNSESIIFGDVVSIYQKYSNSKLDFQDKQEINNLIPVQPVDYCTATQIILDEKVHDQTTQSVLKGLQDTQIVTNVHEADTQPQSAKQKKVHDLPNHLQLCKAKENGSLTPSSDKTEDYDIEEVVEENHTNISHSEMYDDVFKNDSFRLSVLPTSDCKYDNEVDETLLNNNKSNISAINNESKNLTNLNLGADFDDDIILSTQDDALIEEKTVEVINKVELGHRNSKEGVFQTNIAKTDSCIKEGEDSETDIEDEEELKKKILQKSTQNTDFIVKNECKNIESIGTRDDSDTDIEDAEIIKKNLSQIDYEINKCTKEAIYDSDTDVEEDLLLTTNIQRGNILNNENHISNLFGKTTDGTIYAINSDTDEEEDLLIKYHDQPTGIDIKAENCDEDEELDLLAGAEFGDTNNIDILAPVSNILKNNNSRIDDDDLQPTQLLQNSTENKNGKDLFENNKQITVDNENNFLAPTQLLHTKEHKTNQKGDGDADDIYLVKQNIQQNNKQRNDDDLQEIQLLEKNENSNIISGPCKFLRSKNPVPIELHENKINENNKIQITADDEDDFLAPTQLLQTEDNKTNEIGDEGNIDVTHKELFENKKQISTNDSECLAPTQLLHTEEEKISEMKDGGADDIALENNGKQIDDDDLQPIQLLQTDTENKNGNNTIFLESSKIIESKTVAPIKLCENKINENNKIQITVDDEDDFLAPTQLLQSNISNTDEQSNIFSVPTQLLQNKNSKTSKERTDIVDYNDDDLPPTQLLQTDETCKQIVSDNDIFLESTQILEQNVKQIDVYCDDLAPTQLLQGNKQDDSIFSAPTQCLLENVQNILPPSKKSSMYKGKSINIRKHFNFSKQLLIHTQKLSEHDEQTNVNEDICVVSTQPLQINNNINIFDAETQICEENNKEILNVTAESNVADNDNNLQKSENMSLKLNENNEIISNNLQIKPLGTSISKSFTHAKGTGNAPEPETQLEVDFNLETQKLYVEEKTSRPDNPLAYAFAEEPTQMTEHDNIEIVNEKIEEPETCKLNIENSRRLQIKLQDVKQTTALNNNCFSANNDITKQECVRKTSKYDKKTQTIKFYLKRVRNSVDIQTQLKNQKDKKKCISTRNNVAHKNAKQDTKTKKKSPEKKNTDKAHKITTKTVPQYLKQESSEKKKYDKTCKTTMKIVSHDLKQESSNRKSVHEEENTTEVRKSARIKTRSLNEEKSNTDYESKKDEYLSDVDDFVSNKKTNLKRTHSATAVKKRVKKYQIIENSDDSEIEIKKKVRQLIYTENSETMSSSSSSFMYIGRTPRKRSIESDDSFSDNSTNTSNTVLVPKRRKCNPLTSSLNSEALKPKVVFTLLNDKELETSIKKLGGNIIDSVEISTVLVTTKVSRSLKFLIAVALGKPIVHPKWITESTIINSFQDPWDYLLKDTESEDKFKFSLKKSLDRSHRKKLFSGIVFILATKKNFEVLKEIIEISGGKCLKRAPPKNREAVVVSYPEDKPKYSKYLKQKYLTVVSAEAIFSCVLRQEINWKQYLLSY